MAPATIEMPVIRVSQETHDTKTYRLQPPPEFDYNWKPGQFITVSFPTDPNYRRAYSLSNSPLDGQFLEITVQRWGNMGTHIYNAVTVGSVLHVIPPRGRFLLPDDPTLPLMFLSGGSGVTPYRGMMRYIHQRGLLTSVVNLYSVRTPSDIIFKKDFEELVQANSNFSFVVTCTRMEPNDPSWTGLRGRINFDLIQRQPLDANRAIYYVCGSHGFLAGLRELLDEAGVPKDRIKHEDWG